MPADNSSDRWLRFLDSWRPPSLPRDPGDFVRDILGYQFTPFHRRWWDFTKNNPSSLLLAPRGHGKSTILTVAYALRRVLDDPDLRVLLVSNTAAQAQAFLREIRHHLEANHRVIAAAGPLKGAPWNDSEISLASRTTGAKEPTLCAMGVNGPVISKHFDLILLDDVVDEEMAASRLMRGRARNWYFKELLPTLEPDGEIHVIGTRYHHDDLYGRLMETGVPALIERAVALEDGVERALWEEKFSLEKLREKREQAGSAIFNAQYQNDVSLMAGAVFKPEWIARKTVPPPYRLYQGVDLAIGAADHHDYFAHVTVAECGPGLYQVAGAYRARLSFEEQFNAVRTLFEAHNTCHAPVVQVGVESVGYQAALVQKLKAETNVPVKAVNQTRDKVARAMGIQGLVETGRLCFPPAGPKGCGDKNEGGMDIPPEKRWVRRDMGNLIAEMLAFPDSDHDDLVDALEIALSMAARVNDYGTLPARPVDVEP